MNLILKAFFGIILNSPKPNLIAVLLFNVLIILSLKLFSVCKSSSRAIGYFTGKYPTSVTTFCPSGLNIQSIKALMSPVGLDFRYKYRYLEIG